MMFLTLPGLTGSRETVKGALLAAQDPRSPRPRSRAVSRHGRQQPGAGGREVSSPGNPESDGAVTLSHVQNEAVWRCVSCGYCLRPSHSLLQGLSGLTYDEIFFQEPNTE